MKSLLDKVSLRELRLVLFGAGAILTVATMAGVLLPQFKLLRAAGQEIQVLEEAAVDGVELDRHLKEQHDRLEDLRYRLYGDMANLPVRQVEAYIIGRLQRISWNNGVELVSVEPYTGDRVQIFQEMLFNVQLVGEYNDLYAWLWEARNDLGYVVVKEYGLTRQNDNDTQPQLVADLSLASYRAIE